MILARRDSRLVDAERDFLRGIAKELGYSRDFYEDILRTLMENKYITEEPLVFTEVSIAEKFLTDGVKLAAIDNNIAEKELSWLKEVADANNISPEQFSSIVTIK